MANMYASIDLYNKFSNLRQPVSRLRLYNKYGLTDYETDSTTYTKMYSIEPANWLNEISSSRVEAVFYDSTTDKYHLRPGVLAPTQGGSGGWFTLDGLASTVYSVNNVYDRLSPTNNEITIYKIADASAVPALSFTDPGDNVVKYLIKPDCINVTKCGWYTELELSDLGFSLTQPIIPKEFGGSFADNSSIALTLDLVGDTLLKNHLLRRPSIVPFNGELVVGGNIKTSPVPSEEGDYGYMDDQHDFNMSYIETGYVGKPTVFYSSTLTEQVGVWGTIPMSYETRAYLRSAAYQGNNMNLSANSTNHLYGQGESTGLPAESGKTYTLTGAYRNNDASVSITGCSLTIISNQVRLVWGATAAQVCYVTIEVS